MQREPGQLKKVISSCLVLILVLCIPSHSALAVGDEQIQTAQAISESEKAIETETGTEETESSASSANIDIQIPCEELVSTSGTDESVTDDKSEDMSIAEWGGEAVNSVESSEIEAVDESESIEEEAAFNNTQSAPLAEARSTWDGMVATSIGGNGTTEDPYLIYKAAELAFVALMVNAGIGNYATAEYRLMADINLNNIAWTPIGIGGGIDTGSNNTLDAETVIGSDRTTHAFKGVFDGNDKTITGLTSFVTRPTATGDNGNVARGFFGAIESAEIKNLTIDGAEINEKGGATGILVGFAVNNVSGTGENISITNCNVTNSSLSATNSTYQRLGIGALVGYMVLEDVNANAQIKGCTVSGTTITSSGTSFNGGVAAGIGYVRNHGTSTSSAVTNGKLKITGCNLTNVTVNSITNYSGGVVGYVYMHYNKGLTLEMNSIATSNLTINRTSANRYNYGGLVGYFWSQNSGENKFVVKGVVMTDTSVISSNTINPNTGGVIGQWYSGNSSNDVCDMNDITLSGMTIKMTGAGSTGYIGGIVGRCYSYQSSNNRCSLSNITISDLTISTTGSSSGNIGGVMGEWYSYQSSYSSCYLSNIKASGLTFSTTGSSSYNIGGVIGEWYSYRGAYSDDDNIFAVTDVTMDNLSISTGGSSSYYLGGIAGNFYTHYSGICSGSIKNCDVTNSIIQSAGDQSYRKGGIIGNVEVTCSKKSSFHIANCETDCKLISNGTNGYYSGGIVGHYKISGTSAVTTDNFAGSLTSCHAKGEIQGNNTGNYYYGGIAGFLELGVFTNGSKILLEDCAATGNVSSKSYYIGGLVGYIENTSDAGTVANPTQTIVRNCYATGAVNADAGNAGGLLGHIHAGTRLPSDTILVENCYAVGDVYTTSLNAGGFVGRPSKNITIRDSYATGDVYCVGYHAGGFAGYIEGAWVSSTVSDHVTIENSYSTGNVVGGSYDVGGFAGNLQWGYLKNCYSIGSAYSTYNALSYVGGFLGRVASVGGQIINCYSTGYVDAAYSAAQIGGFIGRVEAILSTKLIIKDSFFDSTTSGMSRSYGFGNTSNPYLSVIYNGASAANNEMMVLSTTDMIDKDTFGAWNIINNVYAPNSTGSQTPDSPWYIDDEITYPYLYFQADGFNTDKRANAYLDRSSTGDGYQNNITITPYQTTYNLSVLYNSADSWNTKEAVTHKRADYTTVNLAGTSVQYQAITAGAERAYFPYIYGKSSTTYNNSEYKWYFDSDGQVFIPVSSNYAHSEGTLYSLGSVSRTDIVAFENGPYTGKSSNRPVWEEGNTDTYTYAAKEYIYEIKVANYSTTGDFTNVVLIDPLPEGVSIVDGSIKISRDQGANYTDILYYDGNSTAPAERPYYTYEPDISGNYHGRYIFTVYLEDFAKAEYLNGSLIFDQYIIQYTAYISRGAATDFTQADWRTFENIRNKAYIKGDMVYDNTSTDISLVADDENTDPVYDRYWVAYNNNFDDDQKTQDTDIEKIADYYLTDGSQQHMVLDPSDSTLSFNRPGYKFAGWAEVDKLGSVINTYSPGATFDVTHDTILYAQWEKIPIFEFYKVSAVSDSTMLKGAKFKLFEYTGNGIPNSLINASSPGGDWTLVGNEVTTGEDGKVSFQLENVADGKYYQLVETEAPDNFKLPTGQWLIKVNIDGAAGDITYDISKVDGADGAAPPAFKTVSSDELLLTNIPYNGLPAMGGNGTAIYLLIGIAFIFVSVLIVFIKVSALRRQKRMRFTNRF